MTTHDDPPAFADRHDAGHRLAGLLDGLSAERPIVIALPRGGVPVGREVARALGAPLDVLAVRKIGAPGEPEFAIGALAEDGSAVLDTDLVRRLGASREYLRRAVAREGERIRRSVELFRAGRGAPDVRGRTVVVVDDGLATGLTDLAAVRALRAMGADRVVVAVPVGSREALALLRREADEVVCHTQPWELLGVGRWYDDFRPVSDDEVIGLLADARGEAPPAGPAAVPRTFALDHDVALRGDLAVPAGATGLVIFAHGSGSSRLSPRNRAVARRLHAAGLATLLVDLLAPREEGRRERVFDIPLLAARLSAVTRLVRDDPAVRGLAIGYFGASTGAGAALAAAAGGEDVDAVVARGGRPDLAGPALAAVRAPTLLIVGARDGEVVALNRRAARLLRCEQRLEVVDGAGHLFEEPGALEAVAELAAGWFVEHLGARAAAAARRAGA